MNVRHPDFAAGQTDETAASGLARLIRRVPSSKLRGSPAVQALVLIVDDDPQMRRMLASALASFGFRSLHVGTTGGPLTRAGGHQPDLVIVDVSQPDIDGVGLTSRLRDWTSAPILALLAHGREKEPVELLDAGASDYLVKPFVTQDLLGRVRVLLKVGRARKPHVPPYAIAPGLEIDIERRVLVVDGREVHLTPLERKLLAALARNPGRTMTNRQILDAVWGSNDAPQPQYLCAQLRHLRQKIEADPRRPRHLLTEPGGGGHRLKLG
jgi:two-component system, OmpR family, KDP operon response regulator KdpE